MVAKDRDLGLGQKPSKTPLSCGKSHNPGERLRLGERRTCAE